MNYPFFFSLQTKSNHFPHWLSRSFSALSFECESTNLCDIVFVLLCTIVPTLDWWINKKLIWIENIVSRAWAEQSKAEQRASGTQEIHQWWILAFGSGPIFIISIYASVQSISFRMRCLHFCWFIVVIFLLMVFDIPFVGIWYTFEMKTEEKHQSFDFSFLMWRLLNS